MTPAGLDQASLEAACGGSFHRLPRPTSPSMIPSLPCDPHPDPAIGALSGVPRKFSTSPTFHLRATPSRTRGRWRGALVPAGRWAGAPFRPSRATTKPTGNAGGLRSFLLPGTPGGR
jgi:hypothetical protein